MYLYYAQMLIIYIYIYIYIYTATFPSKHTYTYIKTVEKKVYFVDKKILKKDVPPPSDDRFVTALVRERHKSNKQFSTFLGEGGSHSVCNTVYYKTMCFFTTKTFFEHELFHNAAVLNSSPRAPPLCIFRMLLLSLQMFVLFERKCPAKWTSQDIPPWFQFEANVYIPFKVHWSVQDMN